MTSQPNTPAYTLPSVESSVGADTTGNGHPASTTDGKCDPVGEYPECGRGRCPTCTPVDNQRDPQL